MSVSAVDEVKICSDLNRSSRAQSVARWLLLGAGPLDIAAQGGFIVDAGILGV
jgi:hypothetical protein